MRLRARLLSVVLCLAPLAPAWAGPLAPSLPSQLLQIRTFGNPCAFAETGSIRLDLRTLKDGSTVFNYTLPAKQVAVIRSVSFDAVGSFAGASVTAFIKNKGNFLTYVQGYSNADNRLLGTVTFDPGVEISDLSNFCVQTLNGLQISAVATGFIAKDK
jgi:hypothetical protein